jgi:hypothetical protein
MHSPDLIDCFAVAGIVATMRAFVWAQAELNKLDVPSTREPLPRDERGRFVSRAESSGQYVNGYRW